MSMQKDPNSNSLPMCEALTREEQDLVNLLTKIVVDKTLNEAFNSDGTNRVKDSEDEGNLTTST
jgi:hypothetical protein